MDFHAMKRPRLQSLCKKHGIPANLKNSEMANRLAAIYTDGEESNSQERSSLSTVDEVEEDDALVVKKLAKRVRFSPECETFTYEVSVGRRVTRRKSTSRSLTKNPDPVDKNVPIAEESKELINGLIRTTRSRAKMVEEKEEVSTVVSPPARKKRGRRNAVKSDSSGSYGGINKLNEGARDHPKRSRRNIRKPDEVEKAEVVFRSRRLQAQSKEEVSKVQVEPLDVLEKEVLIVESDDTKNDEVGAEENQTIIQEDLKLMNDSRVNAAEQVQEVTIMSQVDKQGVKDCPKRLRRNTRKADEVEKIEVVSRTTRSRARCKEEASGVQGKPLDVLEKEVLVVDSSESRNDGIDAEENETNIQEEQKIMEMDDSNVTAVEQVQEVTVVCQVDKQGVRDRPKRSRRNYRNADVEKVEIVSRSRRSGKQKKKQASGVQGEPSDVLEKEVLSVMNIESKNDGVDAEVNRTIIEEDQKLMELHDYDGTAVDQVQEVTVMCQVDKHGEVDSSRMDTDMYFKRDEEISVDISSSGEEIILQGSVTEENIVAAIVKQEIPAKSTLIAAVEKSSEGQLNLNGQSVQKLSGSALKTQVESSIGNLEDPVFNQVENEETKEGMIQSTLEFMLDEDSQQAEDGKVIASLGVTVELECEMGGQSCQTLGSGGNNAAADLINSDHKESESKVNDMDSDEKTSTPVYYSITNQKGCADKPPSPLGLDQGVETEEPPGCENMSCTIGDVEYQCSKAPIEQDQFLELNDNGVVFAEAEKEVTINDYQNQLCESNGLKCTSPTPLKNVEEADSNALSVEKNLPQGDSSDKAIDKEETWDESFLDAIESCFENVVERHWNASASRPALESQVEDTVIKGETGLSNTVCGGCSPEKKVDSQQKSTHFAHESVVKFCEDTNLVVDSKDGLVEDEIKYKSRQALNGSSPLDNANSVQHETVEFESSGKNLFSYVLALPANNFSPANEACQTYDLSQLFDLGNAMDMDEPPLSSNKDLKSDRVEADGQGTPFHEDTKLTNSEDANPTAATVLPEVIVRNTFNGSSEHNYSKGDSEVALKKAEVVSVPDCPAREMIEQTESSVKFSPEAGKEKAATIKWSAMDHNATVGSPLRLERSSQDNIVNSQISVEKENQSPEGSLKKFPGETLMNLNDLSGMEGTDSSYVEERGASRIGNASPNDSFSPLSGTGNFLSFNDRLLDIKARLDDFEAICRNNGDIVALPGDLPEVSLLHLSQEQMKGAIDGEAAMEDAIVTGFEASPLKESTVLNSELASTEFDHEQLVRVRSGCIGYVEQALSEDYSATRESSKREKGNESQQQVTDVPSTVGRTEISASGDGTGKIVSSRKTTEGLNDLFDDYTVEENNANQVPMEISDEYEKSLHEAMLKDVINSIMVDQLQSLTEEKVDASEGKQTETSDLPDNKFDVTAEGSKEIGSSEELIVDSLLGNEMAIDPSFVSSADANLNEHKAWENPDESHFFTNWEMDLFCGNGQSGEEMHPEHGTPKTRLIADFAEEFKDNAPKENVVQVVEEQFDGNKHHMVEEATELKCTNLDVSIESNCKYVKDLGMEDGIAKAIKMGSPRASSDGTISQESSQGDGGDLAAADKPELGFNSSVPKEDCATAIDVQNVKSPVHGIEEDSEEAFEPNNDSSELDMPAADQSQHLMDSDAEKELASDENADAVENNLPLPEHKNTEAENRSNTFFTKKMSPSAGERMSKTTFVSKLHKKPKMDSILDIKENLLSPKWHQKAIKTAPKPSSKRRTLEDIPKHQF